MVNQRSRGDGFSSLVRQILILEKRRPMREVADALGMDYVNFHARVIGRTRFKAEEINRLIQELPDPRLCDFLLRNTPFLAVERPAAKHGNERAFQTALRLASESLALLEQMGEYLAAGKLDAAGYERLHRHTEEAERAVSELRAKLPAFAPRKRHDGEQHEAALPATGTLG